MLMSDMKLVNLRVGRQLDDFQSVSERSGNVFEIVRGGDEHDLGQIIRFLQIMIGEDAVLFRIKHFQQRIARIALVIRTHLIDFIDQEDRIDDACLLHALDDTSGQ